MSCTDPGDLERRSLLTSESSGRPSTHLEAELLWPCVLWRLAAVSGPFAWLAASGLRSLETSSARAFLEEDFNISLLFGRVLDWTTLLGENRRPEHKS